MNKYGARATVVNGLRFDSLRERARWNDLKIMERDKQISGLTFKPEYILIVNNVKVCKMIPDFQYIRKGKKVIEDAKGFRTPVYRLKKKLFEALGYGTITEV